MTRANLAWILWCVPAFLILTLAPREPRTALSRREQFIHGMAPLAVSVVALSLTTFLGWLILCHTPPPAGAALPAWCGGTGLLFLLAAVGTGLLPVAFPSCSFIRPIRLETAARFVAGLAWASCWPATWEYAQHGNPSLFLLGAVCGVLPDTLDRWLARHLHRTHLHIVPDPLAPDTGMIAGALASALFRCRDEARRIRLKLYPGQARTGEWHRFTLRLDNLRRQLTIQHATTATTVPLPCALSTDHPFTLHTTDAPLTLELAPDPKGDVLLRVNPGERHWSHSLVMAGGVGLVAGMAGGPYAGLIAGGAFTLHGIADQFGFTGVALFFPFSRKRTTGLQLLSPTQENAFHVGVLWLALILIGWTGARATLPDSLVPPLVSTLLFAGAVPLLLATWLIRRTIRPISAGSQG